MTTAELIVAAYYRDVPTGLRSWLLANFGRPAPIRERPIPPYTGRPIESKKRPNETE